MPFLSPYSQALHSFLTRWERLEEALLVPHPSPLEQEGTVRRFVFAAESGWKTMRAYLEAVGEAPENRTPPAVLAAAWCRHMIFNGHNWMDMLMSRSEINRDDSPDTLCRITYEVRERFFPELRRLRSWLVHHPLAEEYDPHCKKLGCSS